MTVICRRLLFESSPGSLSVPLSRLIEVSVVRYSCSWVEVEVFAVWGWWVRRLHYNVSLMPLSVDRRLTSEQPRNMKLTRLVSTNESCSLDNVLMLRFPHRQWLSNRAPSTLTTSTRSAPLVFDPFITEHATLVNSLREMLPIAASSLPPFRAMMVDIFRRVMSGPADLDTWRCFIRTVDLDWEERLIWCSLFLALRRP